jgi:tyrosyl-tRNA synthetase
LISEHKKNPHLRELQKRVAEEVTILVHSKLDLENAKKASEILFGKSTRDDLIDLDEKIFKEIFEGVPSKKISNQEISQGIEMVSLLSSKTNFLNSNGEVRRAIKENSISINKLKVDKVNSNDLINGKYILIQKGKKNYFVIESFS